MSFCLSPKAVELLKGKFTSGEITPEKLNDMDSAQRRGYFAEFLGEPTATKVNELIESKLLLKNQQQGLITAAKKLLGEGTPDHRDAVSKISKMEGLLKPEDSQKFLTDLVSKKLGSEVTVEQAGTISDLAKTASASKEILDQDPRNLDKIVDYGRKYQDLLDYANSLKPQGNPWTDLKQWIGLPQSALTSILHLSAPFVQNFGMIGTKAWYEGFPKMIEAMKSPQAYKDLNAYIMAHPDYKTAMAAKLGITKLTDKMSTREEAIQSSLLEHIPGVKIPVKASNRGFAAYNNYVRFTRFTQLLDAARLTGQEITPEVARDIARVVNNFTGRGALGKDDRYADLSPLANLAFFSTRGISATMGMLNPLTYLKGTPVARMAALKQLTGMVIATGTILELAHMAGANVNLTDPKADDWLEFKFGKTSFNPAGRVQSYIKLLARLLTNQKTSKDGVSYELGKGFGAETRQDLLVNFFRGKLAPVAGAIADAMAGKDMSGEKFNIAGEHGEPFNRTELFNKFTPITVQDYIKMAMDDPNNLKAIIASPLAIFGMQMKTEEPNDWSNSSSKVLEQFHQDVGDQEFKKANEEYNQKVDEFHDSLKENEEYRNMPDEDKEKYVISQKAMLKKEVFDDFGFQYERPER